MAQNRSPDELYPINPRSVHLYGDVLFLGEIMLRGHDPIDPSIKVGDLLPNNHGFKVLHSDKYQNIKNIVCIERIYRFDDNIKFESGCSRLGKLLKTTISSNLKDYPHYTLDKISYACRDDDAGHKACWKLKEKIYAELNIEDTAHWIEEGPTFTMNGTVENHWTDEM